MLEQRILTDQEYTKRILRNAEPFTQEEEVQAFTILRECKRQYKDRIQYDPEAIGMLEEDCQAAIAGGNGIVIFEYKINQTSCLRRLSRTLERGRHNRLHEFPISHSYLDLLATIPAFKKISRRERTSYWKKAGEAVQRNLRLICCLAARAKRKNPRLDEIPDLVSLGVKGAYNAIDKYDQTRSRFSTFSAQWILQAINRSFSRYSVRAPDFLKKYKTDCETIIAEKPVTTPEQLQEEYQKKYRQKLPLAAAAYILCKRAPKVYSTESRDTEGIFLDEAVFADDESKAGSEQTGKVIEHLELLTERERTVIMLRYGLDSGRGMILRKIGEILNLTKERVRQIQREALEKLRSSENARELLEQEQARTATTYSEYKMSKYKKRKT